MRDLSISLLCLTTVNFRWDFGEARHAMVLGLGIHLLETILAGIRSMLHPQPTVVEGLLYPKVCWFNTVRWSLGSLLHR